MGSYISILNNTEDVWLVKLGPDKAALHIATIAGTVVGAVGTAAVMFGAAAPFLTTLAATDGVVSVCGISTTTLAAMASTAARGVVVARAGMFVGFATKVAAEVQEQIEHKLGMDRLAPELRLCACHAAGEKKTYGKMSLSLWQQCMCMRSRVNPDDKREVLVERLYMRPIFSGATHNSDSTYDIQWWLNKKGVQLVDRKIRLE